MRIFALLAVYALDESAACQCDTRRGFKRLVGEQEVVFTRIESHRYMQGEEGRYSLDLLIRSTGESTECEVVLYRPGDQYALEVVLLDGSLLAEASSAVDFEDALSALRATLEKQNRLLLCNRYRIDAFVSSMSRQMSDGLSCYIVMPNRPVDTSQIVDALASAPPHMVSTRAEADEFISQWKSTFDD